MRIEAAVRSFENRKLRICCKWYRSKVLLNVQKGSLHMSVRRRTHKYNNMALTTTIFNSNKIGLFIKRIAWISILVSDIWKVFRTVLLHETFELNNLKGNKWVGPLCVWVSIQMTFCNATIMPYHCQKLLKFDRLFLYKYTFIFTKTSLTIATKTAWECLEKFYPSPTLCGICLNVCICPLKSKKES